MLAGRTVFFVSFCCIHADARAASSPLRVFWSVCVVPATSLTNSHVLLNLIQLCFRGSCYVKLCPSGRMDGCWRDVCLDGDGLKTKFPRLGGAHESAEPRSVPAQHDIDNSSLISWRPWMTAANIASQGQVTLFREEKRNVFNKRPQIKSPNPVREMHQREKINFNIGSTSTAHDQL